MARPPIDRTGHRYGMLLVLARAGTRNLAPLWHCRCDCGREVEATRMRLVQRARRDPKYIPSCGCKRQRPGPPPKMVKPPKPPRAPKPPRPPNPTQQLVTYEGVTDSVTGWSRRLGISVRSLQTRLENFGPQYALSVGAWRPF